MADAVKGFVEIPKLEKEKEISYRVRVANKLYALLARYRAVPREIYLGEEDFDIAHQISMLYEEPLPDADEQTILTDCEQKPIFIRHHREHGWDKALPFSDRESAYDYAEEKKDCLFWIRCDEAGERKDLHVWLVKYSCLPFPTIDNLDGSFSGVVLADTYSEEVHGKIKRVSRKFVEVLQEHSVKSSARVESPFGVEVLQPSKHGLEWVVESI